MNDKQASILILILAILTIALLALIAYNAAADGPVEMVPSFTILHISRAANGFVVAPVNNYAYENEYLCADIAEVQAAVETLLLQIRPKEAWED